MNVHKPTPKSVGLYYDQMAAFHQVAFGKNIHTGYWSEGDRETTYAQAQEQLTDLLIDRISVKAGQRVLDVGCGVGEPAIRLTRKTGCNVVGISVSPSQVEQANKMAAHENLGDRAQFHQIDAMELPFEDSSFDAAWAFESIFHMPGRSRVLKEIARVLRPGSKLVLTDVTEIAPLNEQETMLMTQGFQVHAFIKLDEYPELMTNTGFVLKELNDITQNTLPAVDKIIERIAQEQDHLRNVYGEAFVEQMLQTWPVVRQLYKTKIGYALVVGQKPT